MITAMMAFSMVGLWPGSVLAQGAVCDDTVSSGESIQDAVDNASAGATVCVEPGTYPGSILIDTANLTLRSTEGAATTIVDPAGEIIAIRAMSGGLGDVTVDGFTVLPNWIVAGIGQGLGARDGTAFHVINNVVKAPTNTTMHGNAIQVTGDGSTVRDNSVVVPHLVSPDWRGSGILLFGASDSFIAGTTVTGSPEDACIVLGGDDFGAPAAHNNTVEDNVAHDCGSGIVIERGVHDTTITRNKVRDNAVGVSLLEGAPGVNVLRLNHFSGNGIGLESGPGNPTTDARFNWWGCPGGPDDAACDDVVGNVTYDPWLTGLDYTGSSAFDHDESVVLEASFLDSNGDGIDGVEVAFFVDNVSVGAALTNATGFASLSLGTMDPGVYDVRAEALNGCFVANAEVTVEEGADRPTPPEPPQPVCGPQSRGHAESDPPTNVVEWEAFHNATSYNVYRSSGSGGFELLATTDANATGFRDGKVSVGTTYQYRATAVNGSWESEHCGGVTITAIPVFSTGFAAAAAALVGIAAYALSRRRY